MLRSNALLAIAFVLLYGCASDTPRVQFVATSAGTTCAGVVALRGANDRKILDACTSGNSGIGAALPRRAALDEEMDALVIGVSNFRLSGPAFAPGNALTAQVVYRLLYGLRDWGAGDSARYAQGDGVGISKSTFIRLASVPRRWDPTGLFEAVDELMNSIESARTGRRGEMFGSRAESWKERRRLTKDEVWSTVLAQSARLRASKATLVFVYLATYRVASTSGESFLLFSDSEVSRFDTLTPVSQFVRHFADLARSRDDLTVVLVLDTEAASGVIPGQSKAAGLTASRAKNFAFVNVQWKPSHSWYWHKDVQGIYVSSTRTANSEKQRVYSSEILNLSQQATMSGFPIAMATILKRCEAQDIDSDDVPQISLGEWLLQAISLTKAQAANEVEMGYQFGLDDSGAQNFGPPIFCPAPGDVGR